MTWMTILLLAVGTYALRVAGPLLGSRLTVSDTVRRHLSLSAVALLAALIAGAALFAGTAFAGWARPAGVLVGAVCAWRRLPFFVVVIAAAATTALLRMAGVE